MRKKPLEQPLPKIKNEPSETTLKFLACGKGDTILIRCGAHWGLVDCNLEEETKRRLKRCIVDHEISKLKFVVVTHFDQDHVKGLAAFLAEEFGPRDGGDWRVEQLVLPIPVQHAADEDTFKVFKYFERVRKAMGDPDASTEPEDEIAVALGTKAFCKDAIELLDLAMVFKNLPPISGTPRLAYRQPINALDPKLHADVDMFFLAPSDAETDRFLDFIRSFAQVAHTPFADHVTKEQMAAHLNEIRQRRPFATPNWNKISIALGLYNWQHSKAVLLAGDVTREGYANALKNWSRVFEHTKIAVPEFDVIKASHHGSDRDHEPSVFQQVNSEKYVVISASAKYTKGSKHPGPETVKDLEEKNWTILHTELGIQNRKGLMQRLKRPKGVSGGLIHPKGGVGVTLSENSIQPFEFGR